MIGKRQTFVEGLSAASGREAGEVDLEPIPLGLILGASGGLPAGARAGRLPVAGYRDRLVGYGPSKHRSRR